MKKQLLKTTLLFTFLCSYFHSPVFAGTENSTINKIINRLSIIMTDNNWRTVKKDNRISSYKFGSKLRKFSVEISDSNNSDTKNSARKITLTLSKNGVKEEKSFTFDKAIDENSIIENSIIPYVVKSAIDSDKGGVNNIFRTSLATGYNRTHNNSDFLPAISQGGLYIHTDVIYDPAKLVFEDSITLKAMDYSYFAGNMVLSKYKGEYDIFENEVVAYVSLYGVSKSTTENDLRSRSINGLFTSMDYFRPGYGDSYMRWHDSLYTEQPHIQYSTYKPLMWFYKHFWENMKTGTEVSFTFMTGPAFGINSSITMVNIPISEEDNRNSIFKAMNHKKQNFFYSLSCPVSIAFDVLYWRGFKFGLQHDFYYFVALEDMGNAYEMLNRSYVKTGFYLTKDIALEANYEHWRSKGKVDDKESSESWNRLIIDIKFYF